MAQDLCIHGRCPEGHGLGMTQGPGARVRLYQSLGGCPLHSPDQALSSGSAWGLSLCALEASLPWA